MRTCFPAGKTSGEIDKEYIRRWLVEHGFRGEGQSPALPEEVRIEAAKRYINAYEMISGRQFVADDQPVNARIAKAAGPVQIQVDAAKRRLAHQFSGMTSFRSAWCLASTSLILCLVRLPDLYRVILQASWR